RGAGRAPRRATVRRRAVPAGPRRRRGRARRGARDRAGRRGRRRRDRRAGRRGGTGDGRGARGRRPRTGRRGGTGGRPDRRGRPRSRRRRHGRRRGGARQAPRHPRVPPPADADGRDLRLLRETMHEQLKKLVEEKNGVWRQMQELSERGFETAEDREQFDRMNARLDEIEKDEARLAAAIEREKGFVDRSGVPGAETPESPDGMTRSDEERYAEVFNTWLRYGIGELDKEDRELLQAR